MARPLRIEFAGALYHLTARGDRREAIYEDDADRQSFLDVLAEVVERYNWVCHAFCLMTNHYHLVVETVEGNLSHGMRHLSGVYTQASNRRHGRTGHLFQGRFKGILVDRDAYLLELSRYVVLNPVRAGMVDEPGQWPWSSYRAMIGTVSVPNWLASGWASQTVWARSETSTSPLPELRSRRRRRRHLGGLTPTNGDESFVERMQARAKMVGDSLTVPQAQRRPPPAPLTAFMAHPGGRNAGIVAAYATGAYSYREIAENFGVHLATVGRIVRGVMRRCETDKHLADPACGSTVQVEMMLICRPARRSRQ